jgi:hypothetical protein
VGDAATKVMTKELSGFVEDLVLNQRLHGQGNAVVVDCLRDDLSLSVYGTVEDARKADFITGNATLE